MYNKKKYYSSLDSLTVIYGINVNDRVNTNR